MLVSMWRKEPLYAMFSTMENSMDIPQKNKIKLPYDPAIPFLNIHPKKTTLI